LAGSSGLINEGLDIQAEFGIDPGLRDYYGASIPVGAQLDVGAHEYRNITDFNGDDKVNFLDYAELAGAFGTDSGEPGFNDIYDVNDNDTIDTIDLGIFCLDWLLGL
jgi:hypothetical protein